MGTIKIVFIVSLLSSLLLLWVGSENIGVAATEFVFNPYEGLNYEELNAYHYDLDECDCSCEEDDIYY